MKPGDKGFPANLIKRYVGREMGIHEMPSLDHLPDQVHI